MTLTAQTLTGCYFGDIVLVDENDPPYIVQSTSSDPVLIVDQALFPVYVAALDDTDSVLTFLWTLNNVIVPDAEQIPMGSQIRLDRDEPGLGGKSLQVSVYDSEGASTGQSWILEVP